MATTPVFNDPSQARPQRTFEPTPLKEMMLVPSAEAQTEALAGQAADADLEVRPHRLAKKDQEAASKMLRAWEQKKGQVQDKVARTDNVEEVIPDIRELRRMRQELIQPGGRADHINQRRKWLEENLQKIEDLDDEDQKRYWRDRLVEEAQTKGPGYGVVDEETGELLTDRPDTRNQFESPQPWEMQRPVEWGNKILEKVAFDEDFVSGLDGPYKNVSEFRQAWQEGEIKTKDKEKILQAMVRQVNPSVVKSAAAISGNDLDTEENFIQPISPGEITEEELERARKITGDPKLNRKGAVRKMSDVTVDGRSYIVNPKSYLGRTLLGQAEGGSFERRDLNTKTFLNKRRWNDYKQQQEMFDGIVTRTQGYLNDPSADVADSQEALREARKAQSTTREQLNNKFKETFATMFPNKVNREGTELIPFGEIQEEFDVSDPEDLDKGNIWARYMANVQSGTMSEDEAIEELTEDLSDPDTRQASVDFLINEHPEISDLPEEKARNRATELLDEIQRPMLTYHRSKVTIDESQEYLNAIQGKAKKKGVDFDQMTDDVFQQAVKEKKGEFTEDPPDIDPSIKSVVKEVALRGGNEEELKKEIIDQGGQQAWEDYQKVDGLIVGGTGMTGATGRQSILNKLRSSFTRESEEAFSEDMTTTGYTQFHQPGTSSKGLNKQLERIIKTPGTSLQDAETSRQVEDLKKDLGLEPGQDLDDSDVNIKANAIFSKGVPTIKITGTTPDGEKAIDKMIEIPPSSSSIDNVFKRAAINMASSSGPDQQQTRGAGLEYLGASEISNWDPVKKEAAIKNSEDKESYIYSKNNKGDRWGKLSYDEGSDTYTFNPSEYGENRGLKDFRMTDIRALSEYIGGTVANRNMNRWVPPRKRRNAGQ